MNKASLNVGLVAPGWPPTHFPNGIVSYLDTLKNGFDDSVNAYILAQGVQGDITDCQALDLSKFYQVENPAKRVVDAFVNKCNSRFFYPLNFKRLVEVCAGKIYRAAESLEDNKLDLIEIEESFGVPYELVKLSDIPIITRLHGPHFTMRDIMKLDDQWDYKLRVKYEGDGIAVSHGVTSPSLDVLNKVRSFYNLDLPKAKVIPNPVPSVAVAEQWVFDANRRPSILFVGRFDAHKGGDLILSAFGKIASKDSDVVLDFIGPDRGVIVGQKLVSISEYLETVIPESSIRKRVNFLGHQTSEVIKKYRQNASIAIVASRYETFSISLLESLATGTPTVCTPVGGMVEIVQDGQNGLLSEDVSAESLADRASFLLSQPELMQALSMNAVADVSNRFSPEAVAKQTFEYYKSIL